MKIKSSYWYAAGPEVGQVLALLSDGAFKLYVFLCLNAKRDTGSISISYADAAAALNKPKRSINTYFRELRDRGVCIVKPGINQRQCTIVEIVDGFWNYTKDTYNTEAVGLESYIQKIKSLLSDRACIKCTFGVADQKLAASYFVQDVSLEQIEKAIALGCCNRYISWLNNEDSSYDLIVSFHYFSNNVEDVRNGEFLPGYLEHAIEKMTKLESQWLHKTGRDVEVP